MDGVGWEVRGWKRGTELPNLYSTLSCKTLFWESGSHPANPSQPRKSEGAPIQPSARQAYPGGNTPPRGPETHSGKHTRIPLGPHPSEIAVSIHRHEKPGGGWNVGRRAGATRQAGSGMTEGTDHPGHRQVSIRQAGDRNKSNEEKQTAGEPKESKECLRVNSLCQWPRSRLV